MYRSSARGQREFCGQCRAQIAYRPDPPAETIDINATTLDEPNRVRPSHHIWTRSRIAWFETADDLPRFESEAPGPADGK